MLLVYICLFSMYNKRPLDANGVVNGNELYKLSESVIKHFNHITFLRTCKINNAIPKGLIIKKDACISGSSDFLLEWQRVKRHTDIQNLLFSTC